MTFLSDFYEWLSDSEITGGRIYPTVLPAGVTLPATVYNVISAPMETPTHDDDTDTAGRVRIQVDSWATTLSGAVSAGSTVRLRAQQFTTDECHFTRLDNFNIIFDTDTGWYRFINEFILSVKLT